MFSHLKKFFLPYISIYIDFHISHIEINKLLFLYFAIKTFMAIYSNNLHFYIFCINVRLFPCKIRGLR